MYNETIHFISSSRLSALFAGFCTGMSPAVGAHVALLPKHDEASSIARGPSVAGAVFNVSTSIIGAGIMSIPATLKVLGVLPDFTLIVIVALLADVSVEFLIRFTRSGESTTYAGLMKESFGLVGSVATQVCVIITNFGCLIMYLIIIGDVLSGNKPGGAVHLGVLQEWFGNQWWNSREVSLLVIVVFVMLPLVLLRTVDSLRFSSFVSVLLAVIFVGISSSLAIIAFLEGKTKRARLLPMLEGETSFFDLFTVVPVIVTAFTFHFNVHPIGFEMRRSGDMITAVRISLVLCAVIYFSIGLFGFLLFGDSIMADILVNFDRSSGSTAGPLLNDVVRLSYALHLMLVFPLLNFSLRINLDELLFSKKTLLASDSKRFLGLTFFLLAFSYLAAIAFPDIWYLFQFLGSTSAVCLAFIFPGAIVLRDINGVATLRDKMMAATMVGLAVATSAMAIFTNIFRTSS